ncbi:MAG: sigma 54-interacting transcriptional regulator [gamma proteobacterium symbiont of Lucinoma myriamae]|nr:sigma 54-interacting transcriptional regulator [gamma proteobacterium symbiont of Lucinoma myriamae]MCU7818708.1 sigma 54-interacting transcriptional regulator [gamma proteobacterium symbiont of Lucinoma myriamae]MCU7832979.1 sigma 54-interacting transcriptional regulator [gamma proteobacterium symbiont of Lucinoma myriamae]
MSEGHKTLYADVRIICATNRNLLHEVKAGNFREDLYYRIACITISIPNLNERSEDIPLLIYALFNRINQIRKTKVCLTDEALTWLKNYAFPGNIRELRNILHSAAASCQNKHINLEQLQCVMSPDAFSLSSQQLLTSGMSLVNNEKIEPKEQQSLADIEQQQIALLLKQFSGNRKQVASQLGISVRTLYRKLNKYAIT